MVPFNLICVMIYKKRIILYVNVLINAYFLTKRKLIIGYIGRFFCFSSGAKKAYMSLVNNEVIGKNCDEKQTEAESENDYINIKNKPAYLKMREKTQVYSEKPNSEFVSNLNSSENPFSIEMYYDFDEILIKIKKSFESSQPKDENLKFLKTILECQNLLLAFNLNSSNDPIKKKNESNSKELLDEWKLLALIIDKCCFVLHLFVFFISCFIFIFREQEDID